MFNVTIKALRWELQIGFTLTPPRKPRPTAEPRPNPASASAQGTQYGDPQRPRRVVGFRLPSAK